MQKQWIVVVSFVTVLVVMIDRVLIARHLSPTPEQESGGHPIKLFLSRVEFEDWHKAHLNAHLHVEQKLEELQSPLKELSKQVSRLEKEVIDLSDLKLKNQVQSLRLELNEVRQRVMNDTRSLTGVASSPPTEGPLDAGHLELVEGDMRQLQWRVDRALRQLEQEISVLKAKLSNQSSSRHPKTSSRRSLFPAIQRCDVPCSDHGLSVNLPEITDGCECVCVGGWKGDFCENSPSSLEHHVDEKVGQPPRLIIPMEREDLPPLNETPKGCLAAAKEYYLKRYKSEEFRTDRALKFFWFLARNSMQPQCSTAATQTVIVDIGAKVGEHFEYWEREFLNLTHCERNDTVLVMVEPNPANLPLLRRRVKRGESERWNGTQQGSSSSGKVIVVDNPISHYAGTARFVVDLSQNQGGGQGNERGSLDLSRIARDKNRNVRSFLTRVETLPTLFTSFPYGTLRTNFTISVLKIDAEGYDPPIIYGAQALLPRTNIVVFECHKLWKTAGYSFRDVAEYFAKNGFHTYKMGMFYWIPVTPPAYWDDLYDETLEWSNCIAIRVGHPFQHMFSLPPPCQ
jgi:hypothetical protein